MSTRGGLTGVLSRHIRKKCVVTTNCEKSAEVIVPGEKTSGRTEQSQALSKRKKEANTMKAEYPEDRSYPQKDSAEHEGYVGAQSVGCREVAEQDGADLLERILSRDNLNRAYKRVRANKGAPGIDGRPSMMRCPGWENTGRSFWKASDRGSTSPSRCVGRRFPSRMAV